MTNRRTSDELGTRAAAVGLALAELLADHDGELDMRARAELYRAAGVLLRLVVDGRPLPPPG